MSTSKDVAQHRAAQPLSFYDMSHRYFLAPAPQTEATEGPIERQELTVYNLASAPLEAKRFLVKHALTTAQNGGGRFTGAAVTTLNLEDTTTFWWLLNDLLGSHAEIALYTSAEAAEAARQAQKAEVTAQ